MTEFFDTSGIRDDDAHWDALAAHVASVASRAPAAPWRRSIDSPALWAGAAVLFAASLIIMMASARSSVSAREDRVWRSAFAPADDVGRALAVRDAPPSISALVLEPLAGAAR